MRILGIDIGTHSIKAVETESAFGRYDIHDYHTQALEPGKAINEALASLMKRLSKTPDQVIVSMPTHQTTLRNLDFPTRAKKALQSGIAFELEDELPFALEDCIYDYAIVSQNKKSSSTHVAASLKKNVKAYLSTLQQAGLDPDYLSTEAWGYRTLMNRILSAKLQETPTLLIKIGQSKTKLYLHWKTQPILMLSFPWGSNDITEAICKKYEIPFQEAQAVQLDQGAFLNAIMETHPKNFKQMELSECIEAACHPLTQELKQIFLSTRNRVQHPIQRVYLTGGTSLIPGMKEWLEAQIETPTERLRALSSIHPSGVSYSDEADLRFALAAGLTLCLVGSEKSQCINLRQNSLAKQGKIQSINFNSLKKPLVSLGFIVATLFLSLIIQSQVYESELKKTNHLLEKSIHGFFGKTTKSSIRSYITNTKALKSSIKKELDKQKELSSLFGPNPTSALDFLNVISTKIPKDLVLDLYKFSVGGNPEEPYSKMQSSQKTTLTFLVSNPQMAEKLGNILKTQIKNMERSKMEEVHVSDQSEVKWKVTFSGVPEEGAYGL